MPFCHLIRHGSLGLRKKVQSCGTVKSLVAAPLIVVSYRSCRLVPTPGRAATTGMPNDASSAAGPMPLSLSSCGVLKAPAARITSLFAATDPATPAPAPSDRASARYRLAPERKSTPTAAGGEVPVWLKRTLVTSVFMRKSSWYLREPSGFLALTVSKKNKHRPDHTQKTTTNDNRKTHKNETRDGVSSFRSVISTPSR